MMFASLPWLVAVDIVCFSEDETIQGGSDVDEYGTYYSHIQNEEVYHDLCSIHKQHVQAQVTISIILIRSYNPL